MFRQSNRWWFLAISGEHGLAPRAKAFRSLLASFVLLAALGGPARAGVINISNGYHAQQTFFFCGPASMEMMLDSPAVQALHPGLPQSTVAQALRFFSSFVTNFQDLRTQVALYNASRFFNFPPILGTWPPAFAATMNLADGLFHSYASYSFAPTRFGANVASRTIANALEDFGVPGTVSVHHGAHWIDVHGVTTIGNIARDKPYLITGFYVRDPWPLRGTMGPNRWLAYNGRSWFRQFNPNPFFPVLPWSGHYVAVLDPLGPEPVDDGTNDSTPPPPIPLPSELTAGQAIADAPSDLASVPGLSSQFGFSSGAFDTNPADATLLQLPGDTSTQGDWLVPFDGSSGSNDVTGALVINADTNTVDDATWIDSTQAPFTLSQLDQLYQDDFAGRFVRDDLFADLPEPPTAVLLLSGAAGFLVFYRRKIRLALS